MPTFKYLAGYTIPLSVYLSFYFGGIWSYTALFYAFGIIPLLEFIIPSSQENLSDAEEEIERKDPLYDFMLYLNVPIQYGLLFLFCKLLSTNEYLWWEQIGMVFAMGLSCGVTGINVAHELGHRKSKFERFLAKLLLLSSLYMHFIIEHNRGHHKHVSTDNDPASARMGESIYAFWLRTIRDSYISAWNIELRDLKKAGKPIISVYNEMLRFVLIQFTFLASIWIGFGLSIMIAFTGAAFIGMLLLETINYVEHYGLRREKKTSGNYERVMPWHSWNSNHYLGRVCLYELTRHSDHHYLASRKYQILRHLEDAPQMPAGYPAMMLLSLVPPIWFRIMDPKVVSVSKRSKNYKPLH